MQFDKFRKYQKNWWFETASLLASFPFDDSIARNSALASPNNNRAAPIDSDLTVQRGNVISNRVFREAQHRAHLDVRHALTNQPQNLTLTISQVVQICGGT